MRFSSFLVDIEVDLIVDISFLIHPQTYSIGGFKMPGNYNLPTDRLISFRFEVIARKLWERVLQEMGQLSGLPIVN